MKWVFLAALALTFAPATHAGQAEPWSAKFVANYEATFRDQRPLRAHVLVDLEGLDWRNSPPVHNEHDCEQVAWLHLMRIARIRNPNAKAFNWHGWAGKCWQGAKPAEPLAWSSFAHGASW